MNKFVITFWYQFISNGCTIHNRVTHMPACLVTYGSDKVIGHCLLSLAHIRAISENRSWSKISNCMSYFMASKVGDWKRVERWLQQLKSNC